MSLSDTPTENSGDTRRTPAEAAAAPEAAPPAPSTPIATWRVLAAILLCAANTAIAALLLLQHHGQGTAVSAVEQLCGPGSDSGCAAVARSRWSEVAGVPVAAVGVTFYAALTLLLLLGLLAGPPARAAAAALGLLGLVLAVAADVALLAIQAVAIRAFCKLCLLTYALNALAVVALLPSRRDGAVVGEAVTRRDGRIAFAAWVVAALAVTGGVAFAEWGLARAAAGSPGAVLGLPAPAPATGGGSDVDRYREEARAATEQARRLQEILDDPEKRERYFAERAAREYEQAPVYPIDLANVPLKGPAQAPIKVVEFSDFLCPFCRQVAGAFDGYLPASAGRVAIYYKNYPLDPACNRTVQGTGHAGSCNLSLGAICAQEQGKFWQYHDRVFAAQPQLRNPQPADALRLATEAGLDPGAMEKCIASAATKQRLSAEIAEGQTGGVNGTPTLFVNGKRLPRLEDFNATVAKESQRLGLPPLPPPPQAQH
jgi:protein-disulfide isomerase/uncharacterized membrane protein